MYTERKRKIIIAIIVIALVVILGIVGVFAYAFTDLFKPSDQLFYKYAMQTLDTLQYTENAQLKNISNSKKQSSYTTKSTLSFDVEGSEASGLENLKQTKIEVNYDADKLNGKSYAKANVLYQNQNLFEVEYANSNNIYALKSDEIVTAFVGARNENLKVLAQKFGINDTTGIPDSIQSIDFLDVLNLSEEEKQHILNTYFSVLRENISKSNFDKQSNIPITKEGVEYNTTSYRLDLTAEQLANVEVKMLEALKQDSITLNLIATKAKMLNLPEEYTDVNKLNGEIDKIIQEINTSEKLPQDGLSITVYVEKGKTVLTEIIVKNKEKITLYGNSGNNKKIYILIENLNTENDFTTLEIDYSETRADNETNMQLSVNKDNSTKVELYANIVGTEANNSKVNVNFVYAKDQNTITANYEANTTSEEKEIIELNQTNCAILNDYPIDQLNPLMEALVTRAKEVVINKLQTVGIFNTINNAIIQNDLSRQLETVQQTESELQQQTQQQSQQQSQQQNQQQTQQQI